MLAAIFAAVLVQPVGTPLFDGQSLKGWIQKGGAAKYSVEDGAIVGRTVPNTGNSFLCIDRMYGDFDLRLEFKVHPELNSGVQVRSNSVLGYQNGRVHGYQVEIDPSPRSFTGAIYDEARRGVFLQDLKNNPKAQKAFRQGQWNEMRVLAKGTRLQTWINGVPAADMTDDVTKWGFIALQVHGVGDRKDPLDVRWRNIRILDLGQPSKVAPKTAEFLLRSPGDVGKWTGRTPKIGWQWNDDGLEVVPGTGDIQTVATHNSIRLHAEFMVDENGRQGQANGNSGFYFQGRYEVQVLNSAGQKPLLDNCGALYNIKAPDINMAYPAGVWQTYEVEFIAPEWDSAGKKTKHARFTVWHNGTLIHRNIEAPFAATGGAAENPNPGPLRLQDHGNRIRFRNIWWVKK